MKKNRAVTVSYTHLDVYKRQIVDFVTAASYGTAVEVTHGNPDACASINTIPKPSKREGKRKTSIACIISVSYTHLKWLYFSGQ